ncbi:MAG: type II toxin-antitoxin system prevent-host-death family antitoxin [Actinobacteria bacterium]|jgi:prevent-host-death family protein|nr:type II toxin-antitoxin system prevent-host-death family antitoxin [Actinomycetota bacterium]MCL6105096.1 type II toxin-antitoxin system prevent-host-death family antitoxin [Actinomycetota bacterium]
MKRITAKELRDNLGQIVIRVRRGEPIRVTYRSKPAFILYPENAYESVKQGSQEAMKQFLSETIKLSKSKNRSIFDQNENVKDLYHKMLDNDVKYRESSNN